jgi:polysaccharide biosynthesis transport protein
MRAPGHDTGDDRTGGELVPVERTRGAVRAPAAAAPAHHAPAPPSDEFPLQRYLQILRERWLTVLTVFIVVAGGVAAGTALSEPVYRATGTLELRKQAAEVVPMDALFQFERISEQYLQTEYATLRSRSLLQRSLADSVLAARLWQQLNGDSAWPAGPTATARLAERLHKQVNIDPVIGSRIIRVSFESPDPDLSADVVNALVAQYAVMRQESGDAAQLRLAEQTDIVRAQLLAAEYELQEFVRDGGLSAIVIAGNVGETVPQERLRRLQQELTAAETEGYQASALATSGSTASAALESDLLRTLRGRISELEGEYARLRPTFTDSFPRVRQLRSELAQLDSLIVAEQRRVSASLATQHQATLARRQLLQRAVNEQQQIMEGYAVKLAEYERRTRDVEAHTQLYASLQQKQKEAALSAALAAMDIAVLDAAAPPDSPIRPQPKRDIPLGAIVGLLLGIGVAFVREYADGSLKSPEELDALGDAPLLALIPATPLRARSRAAVRALGASSAKWHRIDRAGVQDDPQLAEAFRGLRTSVLFDRGGPLPHTLLVTSSVPGEGKTTVSSNLALSMAMMGRRVLLVDADMRRPSLHKVFGVARQPGLSDQLAGRVAWQRAVYRDVSPRLDLVAAGMNMDNPSDVLSTPALSEWLAEVGAAYDLVVLDAPALHINVPDGRILAHAADGVLLVVRSGSTSRDVVRRLVAQTPNVVGIVLNQFDMKRLPAYYSDYSDAAPSARNGNGNGRVHHDVTSRNAPNPATAAVAQPFVHSGGEE